MGCIPSAILKLHCINRGAVLMPSLEFAVFRGIFLMTMFLEDGVAASICTGKIVRHNRHKIVQIVLMVFRFDFRTKLDS